MMRTSLLVPALLSSLLLAPATLAQKGSSADQQQSVFLTSPGWNQFLAEAGGSWDVRWCAATGTPSAIFGSDALALARAQLEAGAFAIAETLLAEVAEAYTKKHGGNHRFVLAVAAERARIAWKQGRWAEAEAQLLATEQALAALVPPNRRELPRTHRYLAAFYTAWNAAEPSPARAEQAAAWPTKVPPPR
jgi:hypothetical protein